VCEGKKNKTAKNYRGDTVPLHPIGLIIIGKHHPKI